MTQNLINDLCNRLRHCPTAATAKNQVITLVTQKYNPPDWAAQFHCIRDNNLEHRTDTADGAINHYCRDRDIGSCDATGEGARDPRTCCGRVAVGE